MNRQPGSSPEEEIISKILGDGEAEAKRLLDNARRTETAERRKAEREAEKLRNEILGQAESKARAIRSKEAAAAQIQAKRQLLRAREQAISRVFAAIEDELAKVRENPEDYRRSLLTLAVEAISAVGGSEVILKINEQDRAMVEGAVYDQIVQDVMEKAGDGIVVRLEADPAVSGGGCVAASADGRVVFDNTFKRRLERMKPGLRSVIAKEVLKTNG
jgi:vacuolar-type H+-ATPase subunit E/Vma4